jgi:hypothetical protein
MIILVGILKKKFENVGRHFAASEIIEGCYVQE